MAREGRIEFAPNDQIKLLGSHVDDLLAVIAEVRKNTRIKGALVSDESSIGDFFNCRNWAKGECEDECQCEWPTEETEMSELLGFEIVFGDTLVAVARKMAGWDED